MRPSRPFNVDVDNAVVWVTFDYPPVNVQGLPMLADLNNLAQKLEVDTGVRVVVFQSAHPEIFGLSRRHRFPERHVGSSRLT